MDRHRHNLLTARNRYTPQLGITVVVLDDDQAIVNLATTILNDAGFPTFGTTDPQETLRLIATEPLIRLLITDVMMPRTSGPEIVRQAQRIRQGRLHVLFMTGGFDGEQFRKTDRILEKPWSCEELTDAVRQVMKEKPQAAEWDGPERRKEAA